jgi:hypothetical protein
LELAKVLELESELELAKVLELELELAKVWEQLQS